VGDTGIGVGAAVDADEVVAEGAVWQAVIATMHSRLKIVVITFADIAKFYVG